MTEAFSREKVVRTFRAVDLHGDPVETEPHFDDYVADNPEKIAKIVYSAKQVAKYFSRSVATVVKWCEEGMPRHPRGSGNRFWAYDLDEIEAWKRARPRDPESFASGVHAERMAGARRDPRDTALEERRRLQAEAERLKLEMLKQKAGAMSGDNVSRKSVERFFSQFFIHLRSRLLKVPSMRKPSWPREHAEYLERDWLDAIETELRGLKMWGVNLDRAMSDDDFDG